MSQKVVLVFTPKVRMSAGILRSETIQTRVVQIT